MRHYDIGPHIADDVLENYAMRRLRDDEVAAVEEHVFVCDDCRTQLDATEEFVLATKGALRDSGRKPAARATQLHGFGILQSWFTLPLLAAAVAAVVLAYVLPVRPGGSASSPVEVRLYAMRGPDSTVPQARSGTKLVLDLEAQELPAGRVYEVRVVNAAGMQIWSGQPQRLGSDLRVSLDRVLAPGHYWVRILNRDELVREYGIRIQ